MYQALYRKWRPQTFDEVIGQAHITETLKNQVKNDRLSHAYLFIGTRGTGKTTCARILAKAANCESPVNGNPCGHCPACLSIAEGRAVDLVELDAASNNGVDNVRALREEAVFSPASLKRRVYIVDEVHMLSTPAFNALLKILEEPPEHLMFILATTELNKVPGTILSRCQRHSFHRIDTGTISAYLRHIAEKEGMNLTEDASELIARLADGGVRDALSLLDQCSAADRIDSEAVLSAMGLAGKRRVADLMAQILAQNTEAVLREFNGLWMDGKDPASLLTELSGLLRDVLVLKVAPRGSGDLLSGGFERETLQRFAQGTATEQLLWMMDLLQTASGGMRDVRNPKVAAELCLISLCQDRGGDELREIRSRLGKLEQGMGRIPVTHTEDAQPVDLYVEDLGAGEFVDAEIPEDLSSAASVTHALMPEEDEASEREPWEESSEREPIQAAEDFPNPEDFAEDQPEDQLPQGQWEPRAATAPIPAAESLPWDPVRDLVESKLGRELRGALRDTSKVRGRIEGGSLILEVLPGFLAERFRLEDSKRKLREAAKEALGQELVIQIHDLAESSRPKRELKDLEQFKETQVVS